jgi:hypothetical protein
MVYKMPPKEVTLDLEELTVRELKDAQMHGITANAEIMERMAKRLADLERRLSDLESVMDEQLECRSAFSSLTSSTFLQR